MSYLNTVMPFLDRSIFWCDHDHNLVEFLPRKIGFSGNTAQSSWCNFEEDKWLKVCITSLKTTMYVNTNVGHFWNKMKFKKKFKSKKTTKEDILWYLLFKKFTSLTFMVTLLPSFLTTFIVFFRRSFSEKYNSTVKAVYWNAGPSISMLFDSTSRPLICCDHSDLSAYLNHR